MTHLMIRHRTVPLPSSCRWCGYSAREHGMTYARSVGLHLFAPPTQSQIKARMKARRKVNF